MYGLNPTIDLSFLERRELLQIAVGIYQVQFHFDDHVCISVEGSFLYEDGSAATVWKPGMSTAASVVLSLLGATITGIQKSEDGTLKLIFAEGRCLTVLDNSDEFESYTITHPGGTIVV